MPASTDKTPARRILVVDDNRDSAETLAILLSLNGNETRTAFDGDEALQMAEQFRPDAILLDIGMPKVSGHDVCRHIRNEVWGRDIVMIAQTGWGQSEDKRKADEAGFDAHLVKPVEYEAVTKLLDSMFELRQHL